ncbi:MAG: phosphoribosyltransferase [Planctomycetes bacterium]|nr:phosphoribosyltransferase [Planctomycetota bacterium]
MRFKDREEAGRRLAEALRGVELCDPLVLAIPRGGLATGAALALGLGAELDVVFARKLRSPFQPEVAVGAVPERGEVVLTSSAREIEDLIPGYLKEEEERQRGEIERRKVLYRSVRPRAPMAGRSVVLTDDGLATGSTMLAALAVLPLERPREIVVAVPVAPAGGLEEGRQRCGRLVCLHEPRDFRAISQFYEEFPQVEDEEALALLRRASRGRPSPGLGRRAEEAPRPERSGRR